MLEEKIEDFWNRLFKEKENCFWFGKGWCYKEYPTGYEQMEKDWVKCEYPCRNFRKRTPKESPI